MEHSVELPVRKLAVKTLRPVEEALAREWLVGNGLGGYASCTVANVPTRRYHGLLIAALPAPLGRSMMLNHLSEQIRLPNHHTVRFGGLETEHNGLTALGIDHLLEFRLEGGLPFWRYEVDGYTIEKQVLLPYDQNSVHVTYRLLSGSGRVRIKLRPTVHMRHQDAPVDRPVIDTCTIQIAQDRHEILPPPGDHHPPLRLYVYGEERAFTVEPQCLPKVLYRVEQRRGYPYMGVLWSPGYFRATLTLEHSVTLVASTETWDTLLVLTPDQAIRSARQRQHRLLDTLHPRITEPITRELALAADQFVIRPMGRASEHARARAAGDEVRTVIAGYHWFTDWGRDTMISLEGLTLVTGRYAEAGFILRTFAQYVRDGLIPNMFPDGENDGLYHTADATLWFFQALNRYLAYTKDVRTLDLLLPVLRSIYQAHQRGTRFGIGVDPQDGLLRQGAEGYQLTWMDAKVGDWVVTPRRGKAVEINALWYNALRLFDEWLTQDGQSHQAADVRAQADRVYASFNQRFWCEERQHLHDIVDGPGGTDSACRPNQILAMSLPHAVLERRRWEPVLHAVQEQLLTPLGLRTLNQSHPDYKPQYFGDLRARDAAYHQGTVWAWLIGPFIDAWVKLHPEERRAARKLLGGFAAHLSEACVGSISEIFDGDSPYHSRGCIAQAWSVAEVLRSFLVTAPGGERDSAPPPAPA